MFWYPKFKKLQLLDCILYAIYESKDHILEDTLLNAEVYKKYFNEPQSTKGMLKQFYDPARELENALNYLGNEGYVNKFYTAHGITYKGIVKLDNGGFVAEARENYIKNRLNLWFWIISMTASAIALFISIFKD